LHPGLQSFLDPDEETAVSTQVDCHYRAPIAAGAQIRLTGWIERLGNRDATFWVQAQDDQEQVCDGRIRLDIVRTSQMARVISRKQDAIARRELFALV
jgi:predicted thioesterase